MKPYSEDLRTRIARAIQEGMSNSAAARLVEGATDREVFEAYVEEMLAPSLRSGQSWLWTTSVPTREIASESSLKSGAASYCTYCLTPLI